MQRPLNLGTSVCRLGFSVVLAAFALSFVGCSGGTPQSRSGSSAEARAIENAGPAVEIAEARLDEVGFRTLWKNPTGGPIHQAWIEGGNLYVVRTGSDSPYLLEKLDGETGLSVWVYPLQQKLDARPTVYRYPVELRAVRPDELYFVQEDELVGLDDRYGAKNFSIQLDFPVSTSPVADQENVYVGSWNRRFYALSKQTRLEQWSYITDDSITAAPAVGEANVYFGSEDHSVYSMTRGGGFIPGRSWRQKTGSPITVSPMIYGGRVFVGSQDYKVYCLEDAGAEAYVRWSYPSGAPIVETPFAFREWIFAVSQESRSGGSFRWRLHSIGVERGDSRWEVESIRRVLAADSVHCYALDLDGKIRALRLESGSVDWTLDTEEFEMVLGQSARNGADKTWWGRMFLVDASGLVQAIRPRR